MRPLTDVDYLTLTIYGEARGESNAGRMAVGATIRNRVNDGRWGHTYESVCLAPKQFSCWNANDANRPKLNRLADSIRDGVQISDLAYAECRTVADCVMAQAEVAAIRKATHYFSVYMKDSPRWARSGDFVATVGNHLFFENVA